MVVKVFRNFVDAHARCQVAINPDHIIALYPHSLREFDGGDKMGTRIELDVFIQDAGDLASIVVTEPIDTVASRCSKEIGE